MDEGWRYMEELHTSFCEASKPGKKGGEARRGRGTEKNVGGKNGTPSILSANCYEAAHD